MHIPSKKLSLNVIYPIQSVTEDLTSVIAGEPGEVDGAAAGPGGLRQPGAGGAGVCARGLPAEALPQGLPAENVLPGT